MFLLINLLQPPYGFLADSGQSREDREEGRREWQRRGRKDAEEGRETEGRETDEGREAEEGRRGVAGNGSPGTG